MMINIKTMFLPHDFLEYGILEAVLSCSIKPRKSNMVICVVIGSTINRITLKDGKLKKQE